MGLSGGHGLILRIKAGAVRPARPGDSGQLVDHCTGRVVVIGSRLYAERFALEKVQGAAHVLVAPGIA